MPDRFIVRCPQPIADRDKFIVKGMLTDKPEQFSVNFVNGTDLCPSDIAYHFKTMVTDNEIVENWKKDGEWMDELRKYWPVADGPGFALEFIFRSDHIYTYLVESGEARNLLSTFELFSELQEIDSIQVWGDVRKITEFSFVFSVNFVNGTDLCPSDIAYHFKTMVTDNEIVENWKKDGEWMDELRKYWPVADGPGFALEFIFRSDHIYTYLVESGEARNLLSTFELFSELQEIDSIQVWGDVRKITEFSFVYAS